MDHKLLTAVDIGSAWPIKETRFQTLGGFVSYLLPNVLLVGGIIFFILVVTAGIGVVAGAGGGDAHSQEKAKSFLTYAVVGLIIMFGAYWILQIINYITRGSLGGLV